MPEGDTIRRHVALLRPALCGRTLKSLRLHKYSGALPRAGEEITAVDALGKHTLFTFSGGLVLDVHLGMTGSWQIYSTSMEVLRPHLVRVAIDVGTAIACCFRPVVVRTLPAREVRRELSLGPDLSEDIADLDEAVQRARAAYVNGGELGSVLLDQRVAAGIGNVIKSESLHLAKRSPFDDVATLNDVELRHVFAIAQGILRFSAATGNRRTASTASCYRVYGRARQPCLQCGTPIASRAQGAPARGAPVRTTYWCPTCQPPAA